LHLIYTNVESRLLIQILIIWFIMSPAFAVWSQRRADKLGERLVEEARAELATGGPIREAPRERRLALWPYAIIGVGISSLWTLASVGASMREEQAPAGNIGIGIIAAAIVWLVFHIFIYVKRTSTGVSLLLLAIMIAAAAGCTYMVAHFAMVADFARRL
jgi:hypothetical protein